MWLFAMNDADSAPNFFKLPLAAGETSVQRDFWALLVDILAVIGEIFGHNWLRS